MALKFSHIVLIFTIISVTSYSSPVSSSPSDPSIYETLRSHGLPIGILPKNIKDFSFNQSTGKFEVHLEQSCDTKFETHVRYDFNVSGTLSFGQIDEISGVVAQDLFLWFPVKGIRVDIPSSGLIYFDVGVVFKQFSLSLFETPRDCTVTAEDAVFALGPDHLLRTDSVVEVEQKNQPRKIVKLVDKAWRAAVS
ncbi:hypothetical protein LguiA_022064 [Lonicera macranthoides]